MTNTFERFIDTIIDRIIAFTDYFIVTQHITLSETMLFTLSVIRATWFIVFGVHMVEGQPIANHDAWLYIFIVISLVHFASFFAANLIYRIIAVIMTACIWGFLGTLLLYTAVNSPAVPTFWSFSLLSVFIAVRLVREWRNA